MYYLSDKLEAMLSAAMRKATDWQQMRACFDSCIMQTEMQEPALVKGLTEYRMLADKSILVSDKGCLMVWSVTPSNNSYWYNSIIEMMK